MALQNRRPARAVPPVAVPALLNPEFTLTGGLKSPVPQTATQTGQPTVANIGAISTIVGTGPLTVTGGTTPTISLTTPLPIIDGGTGTATPGLIAGTGISITGPWPDQTITNTSPGGGTVTAVTASGPLASSGGTTPNISIASPIPIADGGTGTATPGLIAGTNVTITGSWPDQTINASGGGGGPSVPSIVQAEVAGPSASTITLDYAPGSGDSLIMFLDMFDFGTPTTASAVSSTNTTWTKLTTFTSSGGSVYDLWVGVVSGVGGTVISITQTNAYCAISLIDLALPLTPTLGAVLKASTTTSTYNLAGAGVGHLVVFASGNDNTGQNSTSFPINPGVSVGLYGGVTALSAIFATAKPSYIGLGGAGGAIIIAEIT